MKHFDLLAQEVEVSVGGKVGDAKPGRKMVYDLEGMLPDRAGGTQERNITARVHHRNREVLNH
jgi:hypothetical protein